MRAVELFEHGRSTSQVARMVGMHPESVRRWNRLWEQGGPRVGGEDGNGETDWARPGGTPPRRRGGAGQVDEPAPGNRSPPACAHDVVADLHAVDGRDPAAHV